MYRKPCSIKLTKEEKLKSLDVAIEGKEKEVAGIKEENKNLLASIANNSGGDVSIKTGKDVSINAKEVIINWFFKIE